MRRITNFNHLVAMVAVFTTVMAVSCMRDEVVDTPFYGSESDVICFGVNDVHLADDEITRGEGAERLGKRDLCSEEGDFSLPMGIYQQKGIESLYAEGTRGSMFTKEQLNTMRIWGTFTTASGDAFTYINGDTYIKQTNEEFTTQDVYLWPGSGTLKFDAFANLPDNVTINNNENSVVTSITYTAPTDVANQKDIIYASASVSGDYGQAVPLTFEHILAAVNFKVGDIAHGTIKSITLKGVYNTGVYNFDNGQWAILNQNDSHKSDYSVPLAGGQFSVGEGTATGTFINDQGTGVLFMIPQIVGEGATVEVVFAAPNSNDRTLTASIAGDDWGKDIITNYTISIDEQYNLNITPVGKLLDAHYIIAQVEVTVEGMTDGGNVSNPNQWKLTAVVGGNTNNSKVTMLTKNRIAAEESNATKHSNELSMVEAGFWCDEYVNRSEVNGKYVYTSKGESARGATQITGTGDCSKELIYILIPENNSTVNRTIELKLQKVNDSKVSKAVTLTQRCPGWTDDGKYGWETVDDNEDGQYGFTFTRKIAWNFVYSHSRLTNRFQALSMNLSQVTDYIYSDFIEAFGASAFATFGEHTRYNYSKTFGQVTNYRYYIYLDYTILNNLTSVEDADKGRSNTLELNKLGGSASTLAFETILYNAKKTKEGDPNDPTFRPNGWNWDTQSVDASKDETKYSDSPIPMPEGNINDLSGILSYVLKKNRHYLYDPGDDGVASTVLAPVLMSEDDIVWYIPAVNQFNTFIPNPNITDKNGGTDSADDYWSSTAAENATNPADAKSYHGGGGAPISRATELGVIAVRDKDIYTFEAPATIDEINVEDMAGGENGEAQWVE